MKELETIHIPIQLITCEDVPVNEFITELSESIKTNGLMNPITVQALPVQDLNGNPKFIVKAGKKRFKALQLLEVINIPCRVVSGDETEMKLVTIEENLRRTNLPWYEIAVLVADWHTTRQSQHGISPSTRGKANRERPGWSMRDTAEELKMSLGFISEAVMVANAVKRDPTLRNISDRDTAVRLVRSASKRIVAELEASAPVEFAVNQVYNGPAAEILKRFDPQTFNACITDPPWLKYIDEKLTRDDETLPVFKELYRVMKTDSFLYLFVGFDDYYSYQRRLPEYGFTVSKTPLIWIKKELRIRTTQVDPIDLGDKKVQVPIGEATPYLHGVTFSKGTRAWEYSRDFELIVLAVKGSPALVESVTQSSIKAFAPVPPVKLVHPNEKPVALIVNLLEDCSHEGSLIIDPFSGSGAHLEACADSGRRYIGIERDHESYVKIKERLAKK